MNEVKDLEAKTKKIEEDVKQIEKEEV